MASVSFEQEMTINPDWGLKNVEKAIRAGSVTDRITPEEHAKAEEIKPAEFTAEKIARLKQKYGG